MKGQFNETLISFVKDYVPKGEVVNVLMDTLCIGKEAAYRRMRGEVAFTFDEAAKISLQLGTSLDNIIGIKHDERAVFDLKLFQTHDIKIFMDGYCKALKKYVEIFHKMGNADNSRSTLVFNSLPYALYTSYTNILKFRIFRWMHQSMGMRSPTSFSSISLPKNLLDLQRDYALDIQKIRNTHIILDRNTFLSFIIEVEYFYKLNLIAEEELLLIKKELQELLLEIEQLAKTGLNKRGNEVLIYISNIDFESCYSYYEWDNLEFSHVRMYSINSISSKDSVVCKVQKEWIESLKRYSVLITQSGEIQRIEFFRRQHQYIENM